MEDNENARIRNVAIVVAAHTAAANAIASTHFLLNIPREPHVNRDDDRQKVADHLQAVHGRGTPPQIANDPRFSNYFKFDSGMANDCESSVKTEDKKGQMRWTTAMDNVLLGTLVEAMRDGKKCGSFALNGMDDINSNTIEDSHDQQATCENNDVEEVEDSMSSKSTKKRPSSSSTKPPPKKARNTDELRDGIFGVEGFSV
ncbi:hypothetical protein IFM89_008318 [Coptis chinensis]|uniref:Uncharacterized protein n=1 Tax=Coptis chinensis TaxID=261450 RepID=A0A835I8Z7_9MAGN|nr:hypothetical protein IFM89_008318 [Coptis chinensis]